MTDRGGGINNAAGERHDEVLEEHKTISQQNQSGTEAVDMMFEN